MGQSKVIDSDKNARRQSWIPGSPLFSSLFSSSPPMKKPNDSSVHRSQSFNEHTNAQRPALAIRQHSLNMDRTPPPLRSKSYAASCLDTKDDKRPQPQPQQPQQPRPCIKKSSTLANILYKAKQRHHRRSLTLDSVIEKDVEETDLHEPVRLLDKDEYEADKSQLKNDFMNLAFTEEFRSTVNFAKLKQGRILDVGCGSGAWCIDMALKYPNIKVIGIDNEDWFPEEASIPPNCQLIHGNILSGLQSHFDLNSFDFIHIRLMALVLTATQYDLATRYCWHLLKPGATLELLEMDTEMCSTGPVTKKLNHDVMAVANDFGFRINLAPSLADYVPLDDCLNLQQKYQSLPMGLWGGRLGVLFRDDLLDTLRRCQTSVCRYYSRSKNDKAFASDVSLACREMGQYHTYANFHFLTVNKRPIM